MRKTQRVVILDDGRDFGKVFLLREMPALRAERWAERLFRALIARGVEVPEETVSSGFIGFAGNWTRWLGHLKIWDIGWVMTEVDECISVYDPARPEVGRPLVNLDSDDDDDDVEEWWTWCRLRMDVLWLHVAFLNTWRPPDFISLPDMGGLAEVRNVPRVIAAAISFDKATLAECDTVYGLEALYMILEIVSVDNHNKRALMDRERAGSR